MEATSIDSIVTVRDQVVVTREGGGCYEGDEVVMEAVTVKTVVGCKRREKGGEVVFEAVVV